MVSRWKNSASPSRSACASPARTAPGRRKRRPRRRKRRCGWMREEFVNLIAKKLLSLGDELAGPASESEIIQVERRLAATLPAELKSFLRQHNGSVKETDEGLWRFWL